MKADGAFTGEGLSSHHLHLVVNVGVTKKRALSYYILSEVL